MELTPIIAVHISAALCALIIGPFAIWARLGIKQRPILHRAAGYAWITMMLASAISAIFIRDTKLPNLFGYTPIHLFIPITLIGLYFAVHFVIQKKYEAHRKTMQSLYWLACVTPGIFTLVPGRLLGNIVWGLTS